MTTRSPLRHSAPGAASSAARGAADYHSARISRWSRAALPEMSVLVLLSGFLETWHLSGNGWANEYYSAAATAMGSSWHDFLFGSMDTHGVMTVDKPPLALWVQALSVRLSGAHPLSMLLPQAIMGVLSVLLLASIVRTSWGRIAGFVAGLLFAITPITVAIFRHNNPDALLILLTLAALWSAERALRSGRIRWMAVTGLLVGLAFETKMGAGLLCMPAILAAWLWTGRASVSRRFGGAALFAGIAALAGGAWALLIALTPAADRPWISGTSDNSIWSLIIGYNGVGRVSGQAGGPSSGFGGGAGGIFGGSAGPLRLLNDTLGGQAGWFVTLGVAVLVLGAAHTHLARRDARSGNLLLIGGTFATVAGVFSAASGIFHPYYVSLLAPFAAGLVGVGAGLLADRSIDSRIVGPALAVAGAGGEMAVLHNALGLGAGHMLLVMVFTAAASVGFMAAHTRMHALSAGAAILVVLAWAPTAWAFHTLGHATSGTFPAGGPLSAAQGGPNFGGVRSSVATAVAYSRANGDGGIAVSSQSTAATAILAGETEVSGIGGFSGAESDVSAQWLATEVEQGTIHWVLTTSDGMGVTGGRVGSTKVMAAVTASCTSVSSVSGLYDCSSASSLTKLRGYSATDSTTSTTTSPGTTRR